MARQSVWVLGGVTLAAGAVVMAWLLGVPARAPQVPQVPVQPAASLAPTLSAAPTAAPAAPVPEASLPEASLPEASLPEASLPEASPPEVALPPVEPPTFDVVRVAQDGATLVAGTAAPGAAVVLRVDGVVVAEGAADPSGQFVLMLALGTSEAAQMMTLESRGAEGAVVMAEASVLLTPRPAPMVADASASPSVAPDLGTGAPEEAVAPESTEIALAGAGVTETLASASAGLETAAPEGVDAPITTTEIAALESPVPLLPASEATASGGLQPETVAIESLEPGPGDVVASAAVSDPDAMSGEALAAVNSGATPLALTAGAAAPEADAPVEAPQAEVAPATAPGGETLAVAASEAADTSQPLSTPTALLIQADGAVRVLDRGPSVVDSVVIDTIAYSDEGDVQIAGRASALTDPARLRIYLNNQPIAVAQGSRGDWQSDLPDVNPGIYTLRVDQVNDQGRVVSRFETPFLRESPAAVAAARAQSAEAQSAEAEPAEVQTAGAEAGHAEAGHAETGQAETGQGLSALTPSTQSESAQSQSIPPSSAQTLAAAQEGSPQSSATQPAVGASAPTSPLSGLAQPVPVAPAPPRATLITVQPGHTLWAISRDRYGQGDRYMIIVNANRSQIRNPDLIYPGQIFALPEN